MATCVSRDFGKIARRLGERMMGTIANRETKRPAGARQALAVLFQIVWLRWEERMAESQKVPL